MRLHVWKPPNPDTPESANQRAPQQCCYWPPTGPSQLLIGGLEWKLETGSSFPNSSAEGGSARAQVEDKHSRRSRQTIQFLDLHLEHRSQWFGSETKLLRLVPLMLRGWFQLYIFLILSSPENLSRIKVIFRENAIFLPWDAEDMNCHTYLANWRLVRVDMTDSNKLRAHAMPRMTPASLLAWCPTLLPPWCPILPAAWCNPAAIRSAFPGWVLARFVIFSLLST